MTAELKQNYRETLAELGFSTIEVGLIDFVLRRMGVTTFCEHTRPRFVESYTLDEDGGINEARWQKAMREIGFRRDAINLAEHGLGVCAPSCAICVAERGLSGGHIETL